MILSNISNRRGTKQGPKNTKTTVDECQYAEYAKQ